MVAVRAADKDARRLSEAAAARHLDAAERLQHLAQRLLPAGRELLGIDHRHGLDRRGSFLRKTAAGDDNLLGCEVTRLRECAANRTCKGGRNDRWKTCSHRMPSLCRMPAARGLKTRRFGRGSRRTASAENSAYAPAPAPRRSTLDASGPVSGLTRLDASPSHGGCRIAAALATVAGLTRPHSPTVAGAAQASDLFPVSPRRKNSGEAPRCGWHCTACRVSRYRHGFPARRRPEDAKEHSKKFVSS